MKATILVCGALLVGVPCGIVADPRGPDAHKEDLARLEGNWKMTSYEFNGQKEPEEIFRENRPMLLVKGSKMTIQVQGKTVYEAVIALDPGKKPKHLDEKIASGEEKGETILAIYELNGDTLKIASTTLAENEPKRPSNFQSKPGSGVVIAEYKREKK